MRFKAVLTRVIKELVRDKRTLALMLIAPVIVLTLLNFVFDTNSETHIRIGADDSVPSEVLKAFPDDDVKIKKYSGGIDVKQVMEEDNLDAFFRLDGETFHVSYENEDPSNTAKVKALFTSALTASKMKEMAVDIQKLQMASGQKVQLHNFKIENSYVYGTADSAFFDKILPILIGFFVFFFVFLISGIALLRERTSGTLERLLATPIKRSELVLGYLAGYGLFAVIQTLIIVFYAIYILDLHIEGSLGWVLGTNILIALSALAMGIFVSTFANSEFQMVQFIPLVVVPQILFSGIIPLDTMAGWVRVIGYFFPLSYGGDAMTKIMIKGQGLASIGLDLGILLIFIAGFTLLNILGLKRYRKV